jgi:hypothetical protein
LNSEQSASRIFIHPYIHTSIHPYIHGEGTQNNQQAGYSYIHTSIHPWGRKMKTNGIKKGTGIVP